MTDTIQRPNEEIKDPKVLSINAPHGKYSFVHGVQINRKYDPKLPPPIYLSYNHLKKTR